MCGGASIKTTSFVQLLPILSGVDSADCFSEMKKPTTRWNTKSTCDSNVPRSVGLSNQTPEREVLTVV